MSVSATPSIALEKLLFSRKEVSQLSGLSLPFIDKLIKDGKLRVVRIGARTLIALQELLRFSEGIETSKG